MADPNQLGRGPVAFMSYLIGYSIID